MIDGTEGSWPAFVLWFVLCATDGIDGFLARRHGTTRSGAFLDPLADKVLVLGAMFTLVAQRRVLVVPVADHRRARDRDQRVPQRGRAVRASACRRAGWRKVKTRRASSSRSGFALLPLTAADAWMCNSFLWVAVVLTLVTRRAVPARRAPTGRRRRAERHAPVSLRCDVVAVGTELLLGQIVDTNSSWIGEQLAPAGIDSHFQTKVGDNRARIVVGARASRSTARRRDRVRRARPDARRHHPRGHRRGDGRRARASTTTSPT